MFNPDSSLESIIWIEPPLFSGRALMVAADFAGTLYSSNCIRTNVSNAKSGLNIAN